MSDEEKIRPEAEPPVGRHAAPEPPPAEEPEKAAEAPAVPEAPETAAPTQAPSESAIVQPIETTSPAENATKEVGPAFTTEAPAEEIGPGV